MLNKRNLIIIVIIVLLVAFGLLVAQYGFKQSPNQNKAEIVVWGLFDDSGDMRSLLEKFNVDYPNIKVNYYKKTVDTYEKDLLEALATGRGPDVFLIHNTWLPKHQDKLQPLPDGWMSLREFQDNFVDVAYQDFVANGKIFSLPVWCDTMALYWNKDFFNKESIARPPLTWEEFSRDVELLTIRNEKGDILRSGAAIGTARNINRSSDILSLLMLQTGTKMVNTASNKATFNIAVKNNGQDYNSGEEALRFYTDFASAQKSVYTWNNARDYSIDSFVRGDVAMMFNYAYNLQLIKARSPHLNFAVAGMPQAESASKKVNYANYWSYGVSRASQASQQSWIFTFWLSQKTNAKIYLDTFKRPAARRDLIEEQKGDEELGVFAEQALTAQSWYQVDNSAIEQIFADMIDDVVLGRSVAKDAIERAVSRVNLLMENKKSGN